MVSGACSRLRTLSWAGCTLRLLSRVDNIKWPCQQTPLSRNLLVQIDDLITRLPGQSRAQLPGKVSQHTYACGHALHGCFLLRNSCHLQHHMTSGHHTCSSPNVQQSWSLSNSLDLPDCICMAGVLFEVWMSFLNLLRLMGFAIDTGIRFSFSSR